MNAGRNRRLLWGGAGILLVSALVSTLLGRYPLSLGEVWSLVAAELRGEGEAVSVAASVLFHTRLPRIGLAMLVGCGLSAAGCAYQGVFRNPMASPDLLGASSGAAFGAALALLLGLSRGWVVALAFGMSLAAVGAVMLVSRRAGSQRTMTLVLAGMLLSSLFSAGTSYIKLAADPHSQLPAITYWLMGSLAKIGQGELVFTLLPMALGLGLLLLLRWRLNLLTLGEEEARSLGVPVASTRAMVILASTLVTAASVAVSGTIGWVGLVVPHAARRLVGNDYRILMPASMVLGAVFLLWVDNLARTLWTTELPIGILTAFLGAPIFLLLLRREGGRA